MILAYERPAEPALPEVDCDALKKRLGKDFYLSFKFSQGNAKLQRFLFNGLTSFYDQNFGEEELNWIRSNPEQLKLAFQGQRFPNSHTEVSSASHKPAFSTNSERFIEKLAQRSNLVSEDYMLMTQLIERDLVWQDQERGYQAKDPHSSHFRDYVLHKKPTGSEAFDCIFANLADYFSTTELPDPLKTTVADLATLWAANHPG